MIRRSKDLAFTILKAHEQRFRFDDEAHVVAVLVLCGILAGVTLAWYL